MWLTIDRNNKISLIRQIYEQIRNMILEGKILEGERIPSTRWLAQDLIVSRNVVMEAYEQLMAEGYIESKLGSGTVVSKESYYRRDKVIFDKKIVENKESEKEKLIDFRSGIPELKLFSKREWGKIYSSVCDEIDSSRLRYCLPEGIKELRHELSKYLFRIRGINCQLENIMIISGSTQGLSLAAKLLYRKDAEVIVEDPVHYGLLKVISSLGYSVKAIEADNNGIRTDKLDANDKTSFVYVTPSHQFPLGGVLPIQRRIELIKYVEANNCYIVEDDYDSEFRYEGQPVSTLYELAPDRVIYIGSFSKILAPALRLGYMILPQILIKGYRALKIYTDVHTESLSQYVLAKFIGEGKLEKHIWKMKKEYYKKRQTLIKNLDKNFKGGYAIKGQAAGLHLVIKFEGISFTEELVSKILKQNVKIYPVERYAIVKGKHKDEVVLGYGHLSLDEIEKGIKILHDAIKSI